MIYRDFEFLLKKEVALKTIHCYEDSPIYESVSEIYYLLEKELRKSVNPIAVYEFKESFITDHKQFNEKCYNGYYYTVLSIGHEVSLKNNDYFNRSEYLEGMLFNVICDHLLFEYSRQLVTHLRKVCEKEALFIVNKTAPGDEISFTNVKIIIDILKEKNEFPYSLNVNEAFVIEPAKSLTCIYIISKENNNKKIHDCNSCKKKCHFGRVLMNEF